MIYYVQISPCVSSTRSRLVTLEDSPVLCRPFSTVMSRSYLYGYSNIYIPFVWLSIALIWFSLFLFTFIISVFCLCVKLVLSYFYLILIVHLWSPGCNFSRVKILARFPGLVTFISFTCLFISSLYYMVKHLNYSTFYVFRSK